MLEQMCIQHKTIVDKKTKNSILCMERIYSEIKNGVYDKTKNDIGV